MNKIRVGIVGYGNLGRGVIGALKQNPDMELFGIFSKRDLNENEIGTKCFKFDDAQKYKDKIDVMILCGGSAKDLPMQTPYLAQFFNTVDSFDTHAKIPQFFENVDKVAKSSNHVSLISIGWDPGLFSLNRLLAQTVLPKGKSYTFWGKGLSQGHSDAIRKIKGVKAGVQYTIPNKQALNSVRNGENPELTMYNSHKRECFVVAEENADKNKIEKEIKTMPDYFDKYETSVNFISEDELKREHSGMAHGGFVIRSGFSEKNSHQVYEFSLKLQSNPEFTANVLVAYARAVYKMNKLSMSGAKTIFDVAPSWLSMQSDEEIRKNLL